MVALDVDIVPGAAPTPETEEEDTVEAEPETMLVPDVLLVTKDCVGTTAKTTGNTAESYCVTVTLPKLSVVSTVEYVEIESNNDNVPPYGLTVTRLPTTVGNVVEPPPTVIVAVGEPVKVVYSAA